jgi:hypothetical protein
MVRMETETLVEVLVMTPWLTTTVQRTGASRHAERRCGRRGLLAPVADLCVSRASTRHFKSMRIKTTRLAIALFLASQVFNYAHAQEAKSQPTETKTKLEAFQAKSGALIIRGFSKVGSVQGRFSTSVEVECKEFTDASSGMKEYGITVTVKSNSRFEKESTSFIDYDEIDSLLKGIEYIAKIDKTTTKLAAFQADYKTKGDLIISTFSNSQGGIEAGVQSGRFGGTLAFLPLSDLEQFGKLITKSKEMLDEIKK